MITIVCDYKKKIHQNKLNWGVIICTSKANSPNTIIKNTSSTKGICF